MMLRLPALFVGLLIGVAASAAINPHILGLFHDDGVYAVVAKALADGDGYRIISLPGEPAQTKYPFFYSALLSVIWRLAPQFPANIVYLKSLNVVILLAIFFVSVVYYQRSRKSEGGLAPVVFAAIVCTNPLVFSFTDYVLSDLLLVLLSVWMLAACRPADDDSTFTRTPFIGVIAGFACLTRVAAAPMALAGFLHTYISRGARGVGWFAGVVSLMIAPWLFWVYGATGQNAGGSLFNYYVSYNFSGGRVGGLAELFGVVVGNARYLADSFQMLYLTELLPGLVIPLAAITALGMSRSLRRDELATWSFFLSSVLLLLIWPFNSSRYCVPLVPVMVLLLFRGVEYAGQWLERFQSIKIFSATLVWFPVAVVLFLNLFWLSSFVLSQHPESTRGLYGRRLPYTWGGFEETFAWIRTNTRPDAVLATAYDPMYFLYTGRKAIRPALHRPAKYFYPYGGAQPDVGTAEEIKPQLVKLGAKYLIVDPMDGYAERQATLNLMNYLVESYGEHAQLVFTSADGLHKVFRLEAR
jgi:hypothetical protein